MASSWSRFSSAWLRRSASRALRRQRSAVRADRRTVVRAPLHGRRARRTLVAGAVIVDVSLLLDLGDDRAAAMTAFDQTGERELVLGAAMALGVTAVENVLHPLPQLAAHDRLVAPLIDAAVPLELAHVDARAQHSVDGTDRQGIATLAEGQAFRPRLSGNLPE